MDRKLKPPGNYSDPVQAFIEYPHPPLVGADPTTPNGPATPATHPGVPKRGQITTQYWTNLCQQYVGLQPDIAGTRSELVDPLDRGEVSNVLFVNGSADPWSSLSYTDSAAPAGLTPFVVATGSHCEDLEALTNDSVVGVFKGHKLFHDLAVQWVK